MLTSINSKSYGINITKRSKKGQNNQFSVDTHNLYQRVNLDLSEPLTL